MTPAEPGAERAALYQVAYDEAVRALSEQQGGLDNFRTRAGLLLSAVAITTSVFGSQALKGGGLCLFDWLAIGGFAGVASISLAILWPRAWEFTASPGALIQTYVESEEPVQIGELYRDLSLHMQASHAANRERMGRLAILFQIGSGLLALDVALWIIAIALAA